MLLITIILVLGMTTAFWSGFYIGYIKREGAKPPLPFDIETLVEDALAKIRPTREEDEPASYFDQ